jgi:hypothetical protein
MLDARRSSAAGAPVVLACTAEPAASDRVAELIAELRSSGLLTDPCVLRALAHPGRLAIFEYLQTAGRAAAAECAARAVFVDLGGQVDAIR